jgi:outer membrane protein
LAVAVVVLYILHFSSSNTPIKASAAGGAGSKVAYFEIDSIQNSYEFFKEVKSSLQVKDMENAKELTALKNAFAAKYQDLQKNGRSLSQAEIGSVRKKLYQ